MPYIIGEQRIKLDKWTQGMPYGELSEGELNYLITRILIIWANPTNYARYNAVMGVLDCIGKEFYRKRIAPYEDRKCEINGEVFQ